MTDFALAEELFLTGLNEYSGKTEVNPDVFDTGLAGAALGDLILQRRVIVTEGKVVLDDPRPWGDPVGDPIVAEMLRRSSGFTCRAWVEHLRGDAREVVARRLVSAGVAEREETKVGLTRRTVVKYRATQTVVWTRPMVRLSYLLQRPEQIDAQTGTLAGLVKATGLEQRLMLEWSRQEVVDSIAAIIFRLPAPLRELIAGVDAAVAALAVISRR